MSAKAKFIIAILVIFFVIGGLFIIGKTGFSILSGLRAYVGGEGLWAKGQKDATYYISQYIFTEEQSSYQSFNNSLKVPLGDKVARLELEKAVPDYETIFKGFVDGGNHPEDIPTMIFLYKNFKNIEYIKKAIEQWKVGDRLIKELLKAGEEIHYHIINNSMNRENVTQSLLQIIELRDKLNEAEILFSHNMSDAARWTENLIFTIMLVFSVKGLSTSLAYIAGPEFCHCKCNSSQYDEG